LFIEHCCSSDPPSLRPSYLVNQILHVVSVALKYSGVSIAYSRDVTYRRQAPYPSCLDQLLLLHVTIPCFEICIVETCFKNYKALLAR
jgi:hypothetical protein